MNNRGQATTKSMLVLLVLVFYAVIITFIGYAYGSSEGIVQRSELEEVAAGAGVFGFFSTVIIGISELPAWVNAIIFTPFVITLGFVFITSLPTFNGGGG